MRAMMMADLLSEIDKFRTEFGISESGFGREFMSDPSFLSRLRVRGECKVSTVERLRDAMLTFREKQESLRGADAPEA